MSDMPTPPPPQPPVPEFTWRAHPAAERPGSAVGALAIIAGLAAATGLSFGAEWAALAAVVLVLSLRRFFFPSTYIIDGHGLTARIALTSRRLRWADARRFLVDGRGGYLSTRGRRSWLDAYRGLHVLFGRHRDEVLQRISKHLRDARAIDAATGAPSWAR